MSDAVARPVLQSRAMNGFLWVGLGGFIGAVARFKLSGLVLHHAANWKFPLATFVVNVSGCLAAGLLSGLIQKHDLLGPDMRLFLLTGLLGGFTTFSAFGLETAQLLQRNEPLVALLNVALSVGVGVTALWIGVKAA